MKLLTIMRGAPGSGKSYLVDALSAFKFGTGLDQPVVCSADHFFAGADGIYRFREANIPHAHSVCKEKARDAMKAGHTHVIIDNTNTEGWQMEPYLQLAAEFNYRVQVIAVCGNLGNVHGVPQAKVDEMHVRLAKDITKSGGFLL